MRKLQFEDPVGVNIKMSNELLQLLRKEAFDALHIDAYRVLEELAEIGFAPKGDEDYNTTCKIKALELLGKHLQLFEGKKEEATEQIIRVSIEGE